MNIKAEVDKYKNKDIVEIDPAIAMFKNLALDAAGKGNTALMMDYNKVAAGLQAVRDNKLRESGRTIRPAASSQQITTKKSFGEYARERGLTADTVNNEWKQRTKK